MKTKYIAAISMVTLLTALGAAAQDGDGEHRGKHHRAGGMHGPGFGARFPDAERTVERMTRHLDLDDTQAQQIRNILLAAEPEITALKEELREHFETTRNLDTGSDDYDVELQNHAARTGELAARAALLHGRVRAEIHAVLTEEQRALAAEGREHRRRFEHF